MNYSFEVCSTIYSLGAKVETVWHCDKFDLTSLQNFDHSMHLGLYIC